MFPTVFQRSSLLLSPTRQWRVLCHAFQSASVPEVFDIGNTNINPSPISGGTHQWCPSSRSFSSSSHNNGNHESKKIFRWLDLENAGLSMLERLSLEEYLLKHTQDNWILVGRHSVWPSKYISVTEKKSDDRGDEGIMLSSSSNNKNNKHLKTLPDYITTSTTECRLPNPSGMVVMGIGGKAEKLLNSDTIRANRLLVAKRFSGGGTVVMDGNAIWTTLIAGRKKVATETEPTNGNNKAGEELCKPFPRDIMEWTAKAVFGPTFDKLNTRVTASSIGTHRKKNVPAFSLREDDYVLTSADEINGETRKMGGNAQAISGRQGWLHHTSFLWDYDDANMEDYLKLPEKRPAYRSDRSHRDFLVKLKDHYGSEFDAGDSDLGSSLFVESMKHACEESLGIQESDWPSVYEEVFSSDDSKFHAWWLENRTRIQHDL